MRHPIEPPPPTPPPLVAPDLEEAARAFFPDATRLDPVTGGEGLARVETPSGVWCVRRWPAGAPPERIAFVHAVVQRVREAGIEAVPATAGLAPPAEGTVLTLGGRRYDAQSWRPGQPHGRQPRHLSPTGERVNLPGALPDGAFVALVETVARIHAASEGIPRLAGAPLAPLEGVAAAVQRAWGAHRERLRPVAAKTPPVQRWLRDVSAVWSATPVVAHLDLWPAHVLLSRDGDEQRITGLLDWEDAAFASPLLDLAQLVTHFGGWRAEAAESALAAYGSIRRLAPEERRLLPPVAALDLVAEAGWLLCVAYAPRRPEDLPVPEGVRAGAEALVASLEAVTAVVARGDQPEKGSARKWNYGPRKARGRLDPSDRSTGGRARGGAPVRSPGRPSGRRPTGPRQPGNRDDKGDN